MDNGKRKYRSLVSEVRRKRKYNRRPRTNVEYNERKNSKRIKRDIDNATEG